VGLSLSYSKIAQRSHAMAKKAQPKKEAISALRARHGHGDDNAEFEELAAGQQPSVEALRNVTQLVNKAVKLIREINAFEELTSKMRQELHAISVTTLPDALASAGTEEYKTVDGVKVAVKTFVSGALPADAEKRKEALTWLRDNDAEDLIKTRIATELGRGQDKLAAKIAAQLMKLKVPFEQREDVNHMTLAAFARERLRNGEPVPFEKLGLNTGRAAKITLPKKKED
jgi:hypothetical protein